MVAIQGGTEISIPSTVASQQESPAPDFQIRTFLCEVFMFSLCLLWSVTDGGWMDQCLQVYTCMTWFDFKKEILKYFSWQPTLLAFFSFVY